MNSQAPELANTFIPPMDRIERKVARLKTLLDMGGTLENKGETLHIRGLRMDVTGLAEMDEAVWSEVRRSIVELAEFDEGKTTPIEAVKTPA